VKRRDFLKVCGAVGAACSLGTFACAQQKDLGGMSVAQLRAALDQGKLTSFDLLTACLDRVKRLDSKLHSILQINPEAQAIARKWDASGRSGVLGGIPVLLKDNIATADQMVTSAGSAALAGSRYPVDSGVAERLRKSGAILMGKANMSEWANFRSNNSTSGWSARGGQCRNPHVLDRSPCGSSSGSAAAVAAGLAPLAIGTETVGSIVCPSGTCGIVGLKPTSDLVPGNHIIPISTTWDTAGPMGRTVSDVALLLGALTEKDYTPSLRTGALKGVRLGVARAYFGFDWRVDSLLEAQMKLLEGLGATIVDPVLTPTWRQLGPAAAEVMHYEFKAGVNEYLAGQAESMKVRTLADVIAFNNEHPELEKLDFLGQSVLVEAESKGGLQEEAYQQALEDVKKGADLNKVFEEHRLDAILGPTNGPAWTIDQVNGDHFEGGSAGAAAVGGYPHITVPAGNIQELPVGLSIIGPRHSEEHLLAMAYDYEQATLHRKEPRFIDSLMLD
jgi:amidase